ncbi:MAG: NAD(P)/FAD-dependent oxidoreductase [Bacilli bacterium]
MMNTKVDVVIVGAGPAGMSAALAAHQAGFKVALLEKSMPGGKLNTYQSFEHFPGYEDMPAQQFGLKLYDELTKVGVESMYGDVQKIEKHDSLFTVTADTMTIEASAVILATGTKEKPLTVPGAETFFGQGISYCASCDGGFFKHKDVAVIGSDEHAFEEAIFLANFCNHVTMLIPQPGKAPQNLLVKLNQLSNVQVIEGATPTAVLGKEVVTGLRYQSLVQGEQDMLVDGIFPILGWIPNHQPILAFPQLLDEAGYGIANQDGVTSVPGLFIIGDVQSKATRKVKNVIAQGQLVGKHLSAFLKP